MSLFDRMPPATPPEPPPIPCDISKCESPVEIQLMLGFERIVDRASALGYVLTPQYEFDPYRLDFAFVADGGRMLAVEVDGHDFHEKTQQQAEWDKRRDRFLVLGGWRVIRFTGSEVYRDVSKCVFEVLAHLEHLSASEVRAKLTTAVAKTMLRITKTTQEKDIEIYGRRYGWKRHPGNSAVMCRENDCVPILKVVEKIYDDVKASRYRKVVSLRIPESRRADAEAEDKRQRDQFRAFLARRGQ